MLYYPVPRRKTTLHLREAGKIRLSASGSGNILPLLVSVAHQWTMVFHKYNRIAHKQIGSDARLHLASRSVQHTTSS